jgi:hypothetical protein
MSAESADNEPDDDVEAEFDPLLVRIAEAFDADLPPVPDRLVSAARAAFQWRLIDAELADMLFDSTSDELVGVRGGSGDRRSFRYQSGDHVIRVHLTEATLIVMVEPPVVAPVALIDGDGQRAYETDEYGELAIDAPELPFRLELKLPGGDVVTPWVTG